MRDRKTLVKLASKPLNWFRGLRTVGKGIVIVFLLIAVLAALPPSEEYKQQQEAKAQQQAEQKAQLAEENAEKAKREKEEKEKAEAAAQAAEAEKIKKDSNTFSEDDKIQIRDFTKENVTKILKAPSTAKFQGGVLDPLDGWNISFLKDNVATVESVVDSQNSFGAMIRSEFRFIYCKSDNRYKVMMYSFEGQTSEQYETDCTL